MVSTLFFPNKATKTVRISFNAHNLQQGYSFFFRVTIGLWTIFLNH